MKILILHRVPYPRIEYHRGINHDLHDVTYLGKQAAIDTLPSDLRCHRVTRPGVASAYDEAQQWLAQFRNNLTGSFRCPSTNCSMPRACAKH
jgi:hypothetical protein